jgi:hypothetical protein
VALPVAAGNEHLPQIAGQAMVNDVLQNGSRFYRPPADDAFMPIEFGAAAARFGHSMVRPSYRPNFTRGTSDSSSPTADPFVALVFDQTEPDFSDPVSYDRDDLLGGYPAPRRYVGWQTFFDLGDGNVKNNKRIDTTISSVLFTLPVSAIAPHTQTSPTVLPQRNLLRQSEHPPDRSQQRRPIPVEDRLAYPGRRFPLGVVAALSGAQIGTADGSVRNASGGTLVRGATARQATPNRWPLAVTRSDPTPDFC